MEIESRAFVEHAAAEQLACSIVTRDHDGKLSLAFDQVLKDRGIQVKPVGPQAPNLNAFIERWVQSLQVEALNHFIVFGKEHFDYIVSQYAAYYHDCRPHQGIGNVLLRRPRREPVEATAGDSNSQSLPLDLAQIKCEQRLGGLLKHYYRAAA